MSIRWMRVILGALQLEGHCGKMFTPRVSEHRASRQA